MVRTQHRYIYIKARRSYATSGGSSDEIYLHKMDRARAVADQRRRSIGVIVGGEVDEDPLLLSGLVAPLLLLALLPRTAR